MPFLLEKGITLVHACPGRANAIAGQTGVFRTHGKTAESITVPSPQALLCNLGQDHKQTYKGQRPATRMGTAALIRTALSDAATFARKKRDAKDEASQP